MTVVREFSSLEAAIMEFYGNIPFIPEDFEGSIFNSCHSMLYDGDEMIIKTSSGSNSTNAHVIALAGDILMNRDKYHRDFPDMFLPIDHIFSYGPSGNTLGVIQKKLNLFDDIRHIETKDSKAFRRTFDSYVLDMIRNLDRVWSSGRYILPDFQLKNLGYIKVDNDFKVFGFDYYPTISMGYSYRIRMMVEGAADMGLFSNGDIMLKRFSEFREKYGFMH